MEILLNPWHPNHINIKQKDLPGPQSRFSSDAWVVIDLDAWLVQGDAVIVDWETFKSCIPNQCLGIYWREASDHHPAVAVNGYAYYNTKEDVAYVFSGGQWRQFSGSGS